VERHVGIGCNCGVGVGFGWNGDGCISLGVVLSLSPLFPTWGDGEQLQKN